MITSQRRLSTTWGQLAGLWTLAVCLPVLQVLADSPDYLIAEHAGFPDLPVVVIGYLVVPPTVMAAAVWVAGKVEERAGEWLQAICVGGLVGAFALQLAKDATDPVSRVPQLVGLVVAVAIAVAYRRTRFVPTLATVLSPAVLLVAVWFLLLSPVAPVARGAQGGDVDTSEANGTPVVMVVFDEFSGLSLLDQDGGLDKALFPNFARLDATWFRNATTVADTTIQAVPAIESGRLKWGELPVAKDYPRNLFSLLSGYRMNVREPITHLCDDCEDDSWHERAGRLRQSIRRLTEDRLKRVDPKSVLGVPFSSILERDKTWRDWVSQATGGRTLNFLHVELPHTPWWFDPQGHQYTGDATIPGLDGEDWPKDPKVVAEWKGRYLQQVQFVDTLIGELRKTLERKGIWDQALVILVADHGVAFQPGESRRFVGEDRVFPEIASVPLFVKAPGETERRTDNSFVKTVDVFATVGDYLGAGWGGHSLRQPYSRSKIFVARQAENSGETVLPKAFERLRDAALGPGVG